MALYRFFSLDSSGHIFSARIFEGAEDLDALEAAQKLCATHGIEIWQGDRLVAQLKQGGDAESETYPLSAPNMLKFFRPQH